MMQGCISSDKEGVAISLPKSRKLRNQSDRLLKSRKRRLWETLSKVRSTFCNCAWFVLRWVLGMGVYFFMVSYIYYVLPTNRVSFRNIVPGSLVASTGMFIVTFIYSSFSIKFANYDLLYGSFAAIISLLVWFWLIGWMIVIGILFNAAWQDTK